MRQEPDMIIKVDPTTPDVTDLIETIVRTHTSAGRFLRVEIYLQQEETSQPPTDKPRRTRRASEKIRKSPQATIQRLLADIQYRNNEDGHRMSDTQLAKQLGSDVTRHQIHNLRSGRARATADNCVLQALFLAVMKAGTLKASQSSRMILKRLHGLEQTGRSPKSAGRPSRADTASPLNGKGAATHTS